MKQILVIDDDIHIGNVIEETLVREGYDVARAYSGTEALLYLSKQHPDLILLDLMLPGLNGEEILPKMASIPVIVVSAKVDTSDKVNLLLQGANDYITKPFDMAELLARITVQLRKIKSPTSHILHFHDITLDLQTHKVYELKQEIKLTKTEYAILKLLMQNPSQVYTKSNILDEIRMDTLDCVESSLKVHISNLRRKLRSVSDQEYIEAVWGIGFKMRTE